MATPFSHRATCLRSVPANTRALTAPASSKTPFSTAARRQAKQTCLSTTRTAQQTRRCTVSMDQQRLFSISPSRRETSPATPGSSTQIPSSASSPSSVPSDLLTWDRFFDLRRKRRFINLGASVVTSLTAVGVSAPVIAQSDIDKIFAQTFGMPMDPMVVLGLTTFAVAAAGWMCGPSFGSAGFAAWAGRRGWRKGIVEKEKSFYARIKRYRADPASSSPQNPIPDYYGEKIASVKDYRRWLKDQRTFARKATKNMI